MKKLLVFTGCLFFVLTVLGVAYANVEVGKDCKGTLVITDPNATDPDKLITMVECGKQPIPAIPNGAILEVFDGEFTVTVTGGDSVDLTILDHEMTLKNGQSVTLTSTGNEGVVTPKLGNVTVVDPIGEERLVKLGERFPIKLAEADTDDETAAGEAMGLTVPDNAPPVDSRGIDASTSK